MRVTPLPGNEAPRLATLAQEFLEVYAASDRGGMGAAKRARRRRGRRSDNMF
jgi:hypothetical protein